ncbi:MAG: hypothetical protein ACM359_08585 [Bacillota bacterium]
MVDQVAKRVKFRKPPVVEITAGFSLIRGTTVDWNWDTASDFLEQAVPSGEKTESLQAIRILKRPRRSAKLKRREVSLAEEDVLRMRRYSRDRSHCLQIAPDRLIVNCVKKETSIPSFSVLQPLVLEYLPKYIEAFKPERFDSVFLNYIDDVEVPAIPPLSVSQYFNINVDFPDDFGSLQSFAVTGKWIDEPVTVQLELRDIRPYTFRLEWTAISQIRTGASMEDALSTLLACRQVLWKRFDASVTEQAKALFEPE